jgi:mRNA-degrading endonuclease RelE of RelBE toxin-antitoxin system
MAHPPVNWKPSHGGYHLQMYDSFYAELDKSPKKVKNAWQKTVAKWLRKNPTETGSDSLKHLKHYKHLWRYRIGNDWRLVYKVDKGERVVTCMMIDLRDRIFEHENTRHYTEQSVGRVALLELRKRGNPLMLLDDQTRLPKHPVAAMIPNSDPNQHVAFMVTNPDVSFGFAQVLKLHWKNRWNAIGMDAASLTRTICALSYAPSLGLHRHTLPGPVYWADGIAGASDTDLRFRGQCVTLLS